MLRTWSVVVAVGLGLMIVLSRPRASAESPPDQKPALVIRAARFELVDKEGKTVGLWTSSASPALSLFDPKSNSRITLDIQADAAPKVTLQGKDGQTLVTLSILSGVYPHLFMGRLKGQGSLSYLQTPNGGQILDLEDKDGRTRVHITLSPDGTPKIVLFDENRKRLFRAP